MKSRDHPRKIAVHAAPQYEGNSSVNRCCMRKESLWWHSMMWKLLLGCVSVYSSSETANCIVYMSGRNIQNLTVAPPFSMQSANLLGIL